MKALITGACGFIGTNMVDRLLSAGDEVIAIDSLQRNGSRNNLSYLKAKHGGFDFREVEIEDVPSIILKVKPNIVYHFAAQVAVTTSLKSPRRDFAINGAGTVDVALAAQESGSHIIYTSTNKVFGDNVNNVPIEELGTRYDFMGELAKKGLSETFPVDAKHHTPYGASKLVGDIYVREVGGVVNRCSCMYGPNQFGIADQGWISYFAINKIKGLPAVIYGDGKQVRDAVHADDVTRLFEIQGRTLNREIDGPDIRGEVFNVGGGYGNTISLLELCDKWEIKPTFEEWRPADQKVFYCDTSKAQTMLNWKLKVGLNQGLKELYDWTKSRIKI